MKKCQICNLDFNGRGEICKHCKQKMAQNRREYQWWLTHEVSEERVRQVLQIGGKQTKVTIPE